MNDKMFKTLYNISLDLVEKHHKDSVDKGGNAYLEHLIYVSNNCSTYEAKIAGLLHDILEDTNCTEYDLLKNNIPKDIIDNVKLLTKKEDVTYKEYISQIVNSNNAIALEVKFWDLTNNMDLNRLNNVTEKDLMRVEKRYKPAREKISEKLKELTILN